eukprot:TRINITY_DN17965_c0_g1_i2.p1 TRINITY_DN17965_c0_g1~~TRINITY_DN17965_c0_g1_i2.p1  ORF type:complete len:620 (-),score=102.45 TRINITY_DN17965_c0_g1_i2:97-1956(-)
MASSFAAMASPSSSVKFETRAAFALSWGDEEAPGHSAELEVRGLAYAVPSGRRRVAPRKVLAGVDCVFPPGRLSAIMGASGSGKTSLLTLLRGLSAPGSSIAGEVLCNGHAVDADLMRSVASVVPQEDVYLPALTPREMLRFAAELRLPAGTTSAEHEARAASVVAHLRLEACADTPIGDERAGLRGISGGERRRLSVGLAVIGGLPQALFCDEITSGLDSCSAASMVGLLKDMAARGVTVVCAIHQPSFSVFKEFDYLLLLEAGLACFAGDLESAESHFSRCGAPTPAHTNPAHHYVELVQQRDNPWARRWHDAVAQGSAGSRPPTRSDFPGHSTLMDGKRKSQLSLLQQTAVLTRRTLLENFKNRKKFFRGIMSRCPASVMVGFFFWRVAAYTTQSSLFPVKGVLFFAIQNPLIETFYAGASTFQSTRGLLKREYYDGLYHVAPYYFAYYIGFLAMQIPWTFAWVVPLYVLTGLPLELHRFLIFVFAIFLVILMACAAGSAVGAKTKDQEGNRAVLAPMLIPMVLFSGYVIPYRQLPGVWKPLYNLYGGTEFVDCDPATRAIRDCFATGDEYLAASTSTLAWRLGIAGMLGVMVAYLLFFLVLNIRTIHTNVLDGRV